MSNITAQHPLIIAGMTADEAAEWDIRFSESKLDVSYEEWCTGVVYLNSKYANHPLFMSGKFSAAMIDNLEQAYTDLYEGKPNCPTKEQYYETMIRMRTTELEHEGLNDVMPDKPAGLHKKQGKLAVGSYKPKTVKKGVITFPRGNTTETRIISQKDGVVNTSWGHFKKDALGVYRAISSNDILLSIKS